MEEDGFEMTKRVTFRVGRRCRNHEIGGIERLKDEGKVRGVWNDKMGDKL